MWRSTMRRIVVLTLALLMAPLVTDAQRAGKGVRIGVLSAALPRSATQWVAFEQRLRELGYGEGHPLELAFCSAERQAEMFGTCEAGVLRYQPGVIVASGP